MSEAPATRTLAALIRSGEMDDDLETIRNAIGSRHKVLARQRFNSLRVGDTVVFNDSVGKNLAGASAKVVDKKRTNLVVVTDDGTRWTANPGLLELA